MKLSRINIQQALDYASKQEESPFHTFCFTCLATPGEPCHNKFFGWLRSILTGRLVFHPERPSSKEKTQMHNLADFYYS